MTGSMVAEKAAFVREGIDKLARIPQGTLDDFQSDFRNLDAALHVLQTTIQALVDLGMLALAERGLRTPRTSLDVLQALEEAGAVPAGTALRFRPIIGFRNRVVHLYDRIDPLIVFRIVTEERDDLRALLDLLLTSVESAPGRSSPTE